MLSISLIELRLLAMKGISQTHAVACGQQYGDSSGVGFQEESAEA